jgi:hypothetical protein
MLDARILQARGYTRVQIAEMLHVTDRTIRHYLRYPPRGGEPGAGNDLGSISGRFPVWLEQLLGRGNRYFQDPGQKGEFALHQVEI